MPSIIRSITRRVQCDWYYHRQQHCHHWVLSIRYKIQKSNKEVDSDIKTTNSENDQPFNWNCDKKGNWSICVSCLGQIMGQYFTGASCFQFRFPASQTTVPESYVLLPKNGTARCSGIYKFRFPASQTTVLHPITDQNSTSRQWYFQIQLVLKTVWSQLIIQCNAIQFNLIYHKIRNTEFRIRNHINPEGRTYLKTIPNHKSR